MLKTAFSKLIDWIKSNKLATILLLVLGYFLLSNGSPLNRYGSYYPSESLDYAHEEAITMDAVAPIGMGGVPRKAVTPQMDVTERMMITESNLSLFVKNVQETIENIQAKVTTLGGYVVNKHITSPDEGASGYITVRVPKETLDRALDAFRGMAVKVVSENITGTDVTDEYVDIEARLETLRKTKAIFEDILEDATDVDDIVRVQDRILGVQSQIESLQGRLQYIDATSSSTLITINLSEDELSLPYTPSDPWRANVIFKRAVRALIQDLRSLAGMLIWVGVYAPVWVPTLVIIVVVRKWWKKKQTGKKPKK